MSKGKNSGRMVRIAYRGFFDDGNTFIDQTDQPIDFPCVEGWMPPVFIESVSDMNVGETTVARVEAKDAYEEYTEDRIIKVPLKDIPEEMTLEPGAIVHLERPDGQLYPARLTSIEEESVTFDLNHSAVAKAMNFEITLLDAYDLPDR